MRLFLTGPCVAAALLLAGLASPALAEGGESLFLPLDKVVVPIIGSDAIEGRISVTLVLLARNGEGLAELRGQRPQLRERIVGAVLEFARLRASAYRPVNAVLLKRDLEKTLQHPALDKVLITEVFAGPA